MSGVPRLPGMGAACVAGGCPFGRAVRTTVQTSRCRPLISVVRARIERVLLRGSVCLVHGQGLRNDVMSAIGSTATCGAVDRVSDTTSASNPFAIGCAFTRSPKGKTDRGGHPRRDSDSPYSHTRDSLRGSNRGAFDSKNCGGFCGLRRFCGLRQGPSKRRSRKAFRWSDGNLGDGRRRGDLWIEWSTRRWIGIPLGLGLEVAGWDRTALTWQAPLEAVVTSSVTAIMTRTKSERREFRRPLRAAQPRARRRVRRPRTRPRTRPCSGWCVARWLPAHRGSGRIAGAFKPRMGLFLCESDHAFGLNACVRRAVRIGCRFRAANPSVCLRRL